MRYLGCKTVLLEWIDSIINNLGIETGVFADLFTGTTTVAQYFKTKDFQLITNDIMSFSYVFQQAYIATNDIPKFEGLLYSEEFSSFSAHQLISVPTDYSNFFESTSESKQAVLPLVNKDIHTPLFQVIFYLNQIKPENGFLYHNYTNEGTLLSGSEYQRQYFSAENARKLDAMRNRIEQWHLTNLITDSEFYLLVAAVIEAASSVSNTAGTYGAFLKDWDNRALKPVVLLAPEVVASNNSHKVFLQDINKLIKDIECDILYLDPPYNQRQYAAYYHLLNTIASWDNPKIYGKTGRRPYSHQLSRYSTPEAGLALTELVDAARCKHILISYNDEGILKRHEIEAILARRGTPQVFEYYYRRYSSHSSQINDNFSQASIEDLLETLPDDGELSNSRVSIKPGFTLQELNNDIVTGNKITSNAVKELIFYVRVEE